MVFDKNETEFKNNTQEAIWVLGCRQLPLEKMLPFIPDELKSACTDYYNFNQNLLSNTYELSDVDFGIKPLSPSYLGLAGDFKNLVGNCCEMPFKEFSKLLKKHDNQSLEVLKANGFVFEEKGDTVVIFNYLYPDMLIAVKALLEAGYANYKVNSDYFLAYCDFRAFINYKRTYEDLHFVLSDKSRQIAEKIHDYNVRQKIVPQKCNYFFRVEYKHKGKIVYIADITNQNKLKINIGFAEINGEAFKMIEHEIEKYHDVDKFIDFWRKNLKKCTNCRQECSKRSNPMVVFGKKTIICQSYIRIINPKEDDLKYIFRLIDLRAMVIKAGISEVFYPGNG